MQTVNDIVAQAVLKTGTTARYLFLRAVQHEKHAITEGKFEETLLAYKNHGVIPEFVTDYLIDVMRDEITVPPLKFGFGV